MKKTLILTLAIITVFLSACNTKQVSKEIEHVTDNVTVVEDKQDKINDETIIKELEENETKQETKNITDSQISFSVGSPNVSKKEADVNEQAKPKDTAPSVSVSKQEVVAKQEPVKEQTKQEPVQNAPVEEQPKPTPTPAPVVEAKPQECPVCIDKSQPHDAVLDHNWYREILSSQAEADSRGMYYLDEVMYIGDIEITNYSVQPVYNNHNEVVYYGLNLWSNGNLIN